MLQFHSIQKFTILFTLVFLNLFCITCPPEKGTGTYFYNRGRDFADIFSISLTDGVGLEVQTGPLSLGAHFGKTRFGLKNGEIFLNPEKGSSATLLGGWGYESVVHEESFTFYEDEQKCMNRKKFYKQSDDFQAYSYTRIHVKAGLFLGLDIGFNPGELLDFFTGIFGFDLYEDDVNN